MDSVKIRIGILATTALPVFLLAPTSATGQTETAVPTRSIPAAAFSESIATLAYIPLDDVARSLGAKLKFDSNRNVYTTQPVESGLLRINPEHTGIIIENKPAEATGGERRGIIIENEPAPVDDSEKLAQTARLSAARQPVAADEPAAEPETISAQASSFEIDGQLVSTRILKISGRPYMPLDDFAAAMGASVEERTDRSGSIFMLKLQPQSADLGATSLLELSRRGRTLVEGRRQ